MNEQVALQRWVAGEDLSRDEIEALFGRLMDGELSDVYKAALLAALATKGETVDEIAGAAAAMRARSVTIPHEIDRVVDTCGTGGDGSGTFNISTAAALVAAAGGVPVAKHGNRSVSSRSGSADVLEALGVNVQTTAESAARALREVGISFLFAPALHPAMKQIMPVRRELAIRTVFNLLGPLTNPAGARRQVVGVYSAERVVPMAEVLGELGVDHALVVHGDDGLDEITTTTTTLVAEVRDGEVTTRRISPGEFGVAVASSEELAGGDAADNAEIMLEVLSGTAGPRLDIVGLNAGAAFYVGGLESSLAEGVERAFRVLRSGAAHRKLQELVDFE